MIAGVETTLNTVGGHDLVSILANESRDFLLRHNHDKVKISDLKGKTVALYFSDSWCPTCRRFNRKLVEVYGELISKGEQFEVVFVSGNEDAESLDEYFAKMPWLAVPFADEKTLDSLNDLFKVRRIPCLVILNESGVVTNEDGVRALREYGSEAYPFSEEKIKHIQEAEAAAKTAQTLQSVLVSGSRDYLVANDGTKVPVPELEGKVVGLYFWLSYYTSCHEFTPLLVQMYNKLKEKGENFEIVLVSLDDDEVTFNLSFAGMPWLAIPFKDKSLEKLPRYFEIETLPTLVVLGPDGKTLNSNVAELVEDHGSEAYPFTPEKIKELNEWAQISESLYVSGEFDYLIGKDDTKVKISDLKGNTVALYFSRLWHGPCRRFTRKLVEVYGELISKGEQFEVVFVSWDKDEESFNEYFTKMPWLAVPFADAKTVNSLGDFFKVRRIPCLVVLNERGVVTNEDGVTALREYGSEAYPFSEDKIKHIQEAEALAKKAQTLQTVLVSGSRDYLVSNDGTKVPVLELEGKVVGLYFSECPFTASRKFTPLLVQMYNKLKEKGENFEIVLVSLNDDEETFNLSFAGMPWLAIPFKDKSLEKLPRYFEIETLPTLVVLGPDGKTLNSNVAEHVEDHGSEAYPFTSEKIKELNELAQAKSESHTLESLLVSGELDYVIGKDGTKVKISDLKGKTVALYFSGLWYRPCQRFTRKLVEVYGELASKGEQFEVVFLSWDEDKESFDEYFAKMPWLAVPFANAKTVNSLSDLFKVRRIPCLVVLNESGVVTNEDGVTALREYGSEAYPFSEEKIKHIQEAEAAAKKAQTLQTVLVSGSRDYLVSNDGTKVPVSVLEGKVVGLYFPVRSLTPSREFTPLLVQMYNKLKEKGENFEIVLVSLVDDEETFKLSFAVMPWLAIPFKDKSLEKLPRYFELETFPTLVVLDPDGKTLNSNVAELVEEHGSEAYPFTPEKINELIVLAKVKTESETLKLGLKYVIGRDDEGRDAFEDDPPAA